MIHLRAYMYTHERLKTYRPLALKKESINQANQEVTEPIKVTLWGRSQLSDSLSSWNPEVNCSLLMDF